MLTKLSLVILEMIDSSLFYILGIVAFVTKQLKKGNEEIK